jgi:hypothetical protein
MTNKVASRKYSFFANDVLYHNPESVLGGPFCPILLEEVCSPHPTTPPLLALVVVDHSQLYFSKKFSYSVEIHDLEARNICDNQTKLVFHHAIIEKEKRKKNICIQFDESTQRA